MRIFWAVISIILTYQIIVFTGVFMPSIFQNIFLKPIESYRYMYEQTFHSAGAEFFYIPERNDNKGVTIYNQDKAYEGYTFLISADKNQAVLVDMKGDPVYTWEKPPEELWQKSIREEQKKFYFWMRSIMNPETGDIYLNPLTLDTLNTGFKSLTKLDKNSEIVWQGEFGSHHDISINKDGNIYALGGYYVPEGDADFPHIRPPIIDESLIIMNPQGDMIKQISFLNLFKNSKLKIVLDRITEQPIDPALPPGDIFHSNSLSFVPEAAIGKAPMLNEGHVLVSFRNLDLLVMIDPEAEKITWASYGPFKGQHSPEIQEDGTLLLFDNLGSLNVGGHSRVLRLDLNDMSVVWEYSGTEEKPLSSWHSSQVQQLPNNNILITEAEGGRILEITPEKEIVWEYWAPTRHKFNEEDPDLIPVLFSGRRFAADDIKFLGQ